MDAASPSGGQVGLLLLLKSVSRLGCTRFTRASGCGCAFALVFAARGRRALASMSEIDPRADTLLVRSSNTPLSGTSCLMIDTTRPEGFGQAWLAASWTSWTREVRPSLV
jgi:hypothetical protein